MLKRELIKEECHELAYDAVWKNFSDECSNAECDYMADQLAQKLLVEIEKFVDDEDERQARLQQEAQREKEAQVYG